MQEKPLTQEQIIALGKHVGREIDALDRPRLFDPDKQQTIQDGVRLMFMEMVEDFGDDERRLPDEVDAEDWYPPEDNYGRS